MTTLIESPFDAILTAHLAIPEKVKAATVTLCETCGECPATCEDVTTLVDGRPAKVCLLCLHFCLDCDCSPCECPPLVSDVGPFCRHERGKVCEICVEVAA
jgi:hypothetical protein